MEEQNIEEKLKTIREPDGIDKNLRLMKIYVALIDEDLRIGKLRKEDLEGDIDSKIEVAEHEREMKNEFGSKDQMKIEKVKAIKNYYKIFSDKNSRDKIEQYEENEKTILEEIEELRRKYNVKKHEVEKCSNVVLRIEDIENGKKYTIRPEEKEKAKNALEIAKKELEEVDKESLKKYEELVEYKNLWEDLYNGKGLNDINKDFGKKGPQESGDEKPKKGPEQNGEPVQQNGEPVQQNGEPVQQNGEPVQQNGEPVQQNGGPEQNNGEPVQQNGEPEQNSGDPNEENKTEDISKIQEAINAKYEIVVNNTGVELTIDGEKVLVDDDNIRNMMEIQKKDPKKFMDLIGKYSGLIKNEFEDIEEAKKVLTENGIDVNILNEIDPMILACANKLKRINESDKGAVLLSNYLDLYQGIVTKDDLEKLSITYDLDDLSKKSGLLQRLFTTKNYFNLGNKLEIVERAEKAKDLGIAKIKGEFTPSGMDKFFSRFEKNRKKVKLLGAGPEKEAENEPEEIKEEKEETNTFKEEIRIDVKSEEAIDNYYKLKEELGKNQKQENEEEQEP